MFSVVMKNARSEDHECLLETFQKTRKTMMSLWRGSRFSLHVWSRSGEENGIQSCPEQVWWKRAGLKGAEISGKNNQINNQFSLGKEGRGQEGSTGQKKTGN